MPASPRGCRWRALWISDVHLGSRYAQVDALLEFLRGHRAETLYLVGDFIDGWELRRGCAGMTGATRSYRRFSA